MKRTFLILALILVGATVFYFTSNYSRSKGKAYMIYPNKKFKMTQVKVWGPASYYYIDFTITPDFEDKSVSITGKGRVQFGTFGGTRWRNNYMHYNDLNRNKVNKMLESMELEIPYLICQRTLKKGRTPTRHYLMITERPELYNQDKELIKLAQKAIKPN